MSASEVSACQNAQQGSCGSQYQALADCLVSNVKCDGAGKVDGASTKVCSSASTAWSTCNAGQRSNSTSANDPRPAPDAGAPSGQSAEDAGASKLDVTLTNASFIESGSAVVVTFKIANASLVEDIQRVRVTVNGRVNSFSPNCDSWLNLGDIQRIELTPYTSTQVYWKYACGTGYTYGTWTGSASSVSIELSGILKDAAPWTASASATAR